MLGVDLQDLPITCFRLRGLALVFEGVAQEVMSIFKVGVHAEGVAITFERIDNQALVKKNQAQVGVNGCVSGIHGQDLPIKPFRLAQFTAPMG